MGNKKKEKPFSNFLTSIADLLKNQKDVNDVIKSNVYGTSDNISKELQNLDSETASILSDLIEHNDAIGNGDFTKALSDMFSDSNTIDKKKFQNIKDTLENTNNVDLLHSIYAGMDKDILKYEDQRLVAKLVPQINEAICILRDSIVSPDDVSKQVASVFNIGKDSLDDDKFNNLKSRISEIFKEKKRDKMILNIVENTLINGKHYCSVVPYGRAFTDLINKNRTAIKGRKMEISEYTSILQENGVFDLYENPNEKDKFELSECVQEIVDGIEIFNGVGNLYNEDLIQEAMNLKNEMSDFEEYVKKAKETVSKKNLDNVSDGTIDTNSKQVSIETNGCVVRSLDIRHIIPIKIDNVCLGYYYIENSDTVSMIKNSRTNSGSRVGSILKKSKDDQIEALYKNICELLVKKLDKKIIETNPSLKETFYDMLKYHDALNNKLKITFLRPDEVVEFKIGDGESVLEPILFFAKLYLALLLTNIMLIIARGNDMRAYYIKSEIDTDATTMVNQAISELKKESKSILNLNHVPKLLSVFTKFNDLFIPVDKDGGKPIDFDIIQGQDTQIDTELMQKLNDIIMTGMGVPSTMITAVGEVDFARTLEVLNSKYLRRIMSNQVDLDPSLTEFDKRILFYELDGDDADKIVSLESKFQSPTQLLLQNHLDQLNNVRDIGSTVATFMLGDNGANQNPEVLDKLVLKIVKHYTPNLPWNVFKEFEKEARLEVEQEKLDKIVKEDNGESAGDAGGEDMGGF